MKGNKWKGAVSWLCIIALVLTSCFATFALPTNAFASEEGTVIDVTDFGADPSGQEDSAVPIQKAIEAAKEVDGPVTIYFPKGEYNIWPDDAITRRIYISNSTTPSNTELEENSIRTIGILLEDMQDVTLDGGGSKLIFHGKMMSFAVIDCENVKIQNLTYDFARPYVIDLTVEAVTEDTATVYIPDCYEYAIDGNRLIFYGEVSPKTGNRYWIYDNYPFDQWNNLLTGEIHRAWDGCMTLFENCTSIEELGNRRVLFHYSGPPKAQAGYNIQIKETTRDNPSMLLWESEDVTIRDINANFLHSFAIIGQFSKDITIDNVDVATNARKGTKTAASADVIQMSGCGGKITVQNCYFNNSQDDPINIHGTFLEIQEVLAPNKVRVRYMERETYGFPNYYVGDEVEFIARSSLQAVGSEEVRNAIVTEVENPAEEDYDLENRKNIVLTFDRDLPDEILNSGDPTGYVVENITYTPDVEIRNNVFSQSSCRGLLCTTRGDVLIEGNQFRNIDMWTIFISDDANGWYESGYTRNVTIRDNVFWEGNQTNIHIEPIIQELDPNNPLHKNMTIEGNTFYLNNTSAISALSVENLTIRDNAFKRADDGIDSELTVSTDQLQPGGKAGLKLEMSTNVNDAGLFSFRGCKNVVLSGNTYGDGLNTRASVSDMDTSEIHLEDEDVRLNEDSIKQFLLKDCKVQYISTDESVVRVDGAGGTVEAVAPGHAQVYASMVATDGSVFESNRVDITVSDGQGAAAESVKISAPQDILHAAGETMQLSAETVPAEAGAELTWSVADAATGEATEAATIDVDGVLTAVQDGVVEVRAASANGVSDSMLVSISIGGETVIPEIEYEVPGFWAIDDPDVLTLTVPNLYGFFDIRDEQQNVVTFPIADGENFEATVRVTGKTYQTYEEIGFGILKDLDNYVACQKKNHLGTILVTESNRVGNEDHRVGKDDQDGFYYDDAIDFKIVKSGDHFEGYYRRTTEGADWVKFAELDNTTVGNTGLKLALWTASGENSGNQITFSELTINGEPQAFAYENQAPAASDAAFGTAQAAVGDTLSVQYAFSDPDGDAEAGSVIAWYAADAADGEYTKISGASGDTWTIPAGYQGKYIKASVIPVDASGMPGEAVYTGAMGPVDMRGDPMGNAYLKTLTLQKASGAGIALSPNFSGENLDYQAYSSAAELRISAQPESEGAEVSFALNEQPVDAASLTLQEGENELEVTVTAADSSSRTYTVTVTYEALPESPNAWLSNLELGEEELSSPFSFTTYGYITGVTEDVESLPLRCATQNPDARMKVTVNDEVLAEDVASFDEEIQILSGLNYIDMDVTAPDGKQQQYLLVVVRNGYTDTDLADLKVNGETIEGFDPEKTDYLITSEEPVSFTLEAEAANSRSSVIVSNGHETTGGSALSCEAGPGLTRFTIAVKAESLAETKYYTIRVKVAQEDNANLERASFSDISLEEEVQPDVLTYRGSSYRSSTQFVLEAEEMGATIAFTANGESFTSEGNLLEGEIPLYLGENVLRATVTAPDGSEQEYVFRIDVTDTAYLSDLPWVRAESGWEGHPVLRDQEIERRPLTLYNEEAGGPVTYEKGLGTHAESTIVYDIADQGFTRFQSWCGIDYSYYDSSAPTVQFIVYLDGEPAFDSGVMNAKSPAQFIDLDLTGVETIQLDALMVDTNNSDHADWADAKFLTEVSASENRIYSDTYEIAGGQATIPEGTTVQEALEQFYAYEGELAIVDADGKEMEPDALLEDGCEVILTVQGEVIDRVVIVVAASGVEGDVTGDGVFDDEDITYVMDFILGNVELTEEELSAVDLNHDGVCNVLDLVKLKRMLLEG